MVTLSQNLNVSNNRLSYVDNMKGLCILAITLLHYEDGLFPNWLNAFIGSFMITGFYITNGWLHGLKKSETFNIKLFIKKRFRSLGIPYLWFSFIILIFDIIFYIIGHIDAQIIFRDIYKTCVLKGIGTLWFLPVIFLGELFFVICSNPILRKYCILSCIFIIIPLTDFLSFQINTSFSSTIASLILAPFSVISNSISAFLMISLSFYASVYFVKIKMSLWFLCLIPFVVLLFCLQILNVVDIGYIRSILNLLCKFFIPLLLLIFFYYIKNINNIVLNYINFWGKNSLILMLTHYSILMEFCICINHYIFGYPRLSNWNALFFFLITMGVEYLLALLINKKFRFLLGK